MNDNPDPCARYLESASPDEQRRAFILNLMASPEIEGKALVANMAAVEQWLKGGAGDAPKVRLVKS